MTDQQRGAMIKSIDVFPWNEYFNTGIAKIDEQHQRLIHLLNRLTSQIAFNAEAETLNLVLDGLMNYAVYHFKTEEAIWHQYLPEDPLEVKHKQEHNQFMEAVLSLKAQKNTDLTDSTMVKVSSFIISWLVTHILENDKYLALVVLAMQSGISQEQAQQEAKCQLQSQMGELINIILSTYSNLATNTIQLMTEAVERKQAEQELAIFAKQLKDSVQHLDQANESLRKQYTDTIKAFSAIIEMRPCIKRVNSKYIVEKAMLVAHELRVDAKQNRNILYAGLLMNIGKISLSDTLLTTPYCSIPILEKRRYLNHAVEGESLLNGLTQLKPASLLIRHQYERYDGTGLPDGLVKQKIPLGSRILAVVRDYFEYLDGSQTGEVMAASAVISQLVERKGSYYDPDILDTFISVLNQDPNFEKDEKNTVVQKASWKTGLLINREKARLEKERKLGVEIPWPQLKIGMKIESVHFNGNAYIINCTADKKIISDILSMSERLDKDPVIKVFMG